MMSSGETIAGRYELLDVIGRGGMGVVYRGRDRVLDRTVAVKVLPAEHAEDRTLVERFVREARAAARLSHPNIVAVYDTGQEANVRYIVMEYVPGSSLAELLRERGPLEVPEAVDIAAQVASALAAAHGAGIIHRDIKPANVMVLPSGSTKVLDFGIARAAADGALTRTTMVLGSAPYIAPEVALGGSADERSDIYSLGCVLYEMLTGKPPFIGDLPAALMYQHANAAPRPPREVDPAIPGSLDALVMRMLAKRPDDRPQDAAQLVPALRAALREPAVPAATAAATALAPTALSRTAAAPARVAPSAAARASDSREPPPPRRSFQRAWIALGAVIAALLVGIAVALAASSGSQPQQTTTSQPRRTSSTTRSSSTASSSHTPTTSSTASTTHSVTSTTKTASTTSSASTTSTPPASATSPASTTAPASSTTAPASGTTTHP
jgi:serine/threonine-protein kinase